MGSSAQESQLDAVKRLAEKHFKRKRGKLADLADVPRNTVQKILMGYTRQPLSGTLQKLYDVLINADSEARAANVKPDATPEAIVKPKRKSKKTAVAQGASA